MTQQDKMLGGFTCPICTTLGDPKKMVKDPRWAEPVHPECIRKLDEWPKHAKNPLGRYGDDVYYEPEGGDEY